MIQAQPYRKGKARPHTLPFLAMMRGRDSQGGNSADLARGVQTLMRAHKQRSRRPPRPKRPARPSR